MEKQLRKAKKKLGFGLLKLFKSLIQWVMGKSFYFEVNGKPVFMKGANYIPNDVFLTALALKNMRKSSNRRLMPT